MCWAKHQNGMKNAEYDDTLLTMITMEVKTMVIDGADTNEISDKRGGRWVCNHDEDYVTAEDEEENDDICG